LFALYVYQISQIRPLLTFAVHPLKTELQRPDSDKELGFIYNGKPVDSESITSVQVAVWNAGTRSIRDIDVLDPICLVMPDASVILSVQLKKVSRPICGFQCSHNQEDYKSGKCHLNWRILEPSDGAVLQIIYAGSGRRDPTLEGIVEGQRDGIAVEKYELADDGKPVLRSDISKTTLLYFGLVITGGMLAFIFLVMRQRTEAARKLAEERKQAERHLAELRKRTAPLTRVDWLFILLICVFFLSGIALLMFHRSPPGPPFGW
jgi:hypothetical protein